MLNPIVFLLMEYNIMPSKQHASVTCIEQHNTDMDTENHTETLKIISVHPNAETPNLLSSNKPQCVGLCAGVQSHIII